MSIEKLEKPTVKLKTIQIIANKSNNKIFDHMTTISKNIYNSCVFSFNIFKLFKKQIYDDFFMNIKNIMNSKTDFFNKNKLIYDTYDQEFIKIYNKYYKTYIESKEQIIKNNKIIFDFIKIELNNIILNSSNIKFYINKIINSLKKIITYDKNNKKLIFTDIIINIIKSFYNKTYFRTKYEMLNHIPFTINDETLINDIKNDNYLFSKKTETFYENDYTYLNLKSEQYLFKICVYSEGLGINKDKLPADIILNIIDKYYTNIKSFYGLINKKIKANKPTYIKDKYNLFYYPSSFKIIDNKKVRLTVGNYISTNIDKFTNNIKIITNKKYILNNHLTLKDRKKNKNFLKLKKGYVDKIHIKEGNFLYINLPKKLHNKKIKLIDIKPYGNIYKLNICYEEEQILKHNIDNKFNTIQNEKAKECISIDTGIKNLLTIYNPSGKQHIIKGNILTSINEFYNKKIGELQSINKQKYNKSTFNRLYSLRLERNNKLKGEINKIINKLILTYTDKNVFIIGYNERWKTKCNLHKNTNRMFHQIPYILKKLKDKLNSIGKKLITIEESYTSKIDSLILEPMNLKNKFKGIRKNRGLFISSSGKAINADLNGAINIMRKVFDLKKITGLNIFNPCILVP